MLLGGAKISQLVISAGFGVLVVVMHGDEVMVRIVFAQPFQPALLVVEILFVVRLLGKIPDHIWIRSVTGNQPAEEKFFLVAAVRWPLDLLVIDLDEYMRLHTALIQRGHPSVVMPPIGNIHPALVGLLVVPCPR